uniref:30S ribosomal protein S3, chloroplastic n=1 Tax=Gossypium raimondii TaxID=29730 RepID=A0A0D2V1A0_GOSRA|nr:hypothetical protein B456_012G056700 [Gossypium raimondii]
MGGCGQKLRRKKNRSFEYSTKLLEKTESKRDIYMLSSAVEGIARIEIQKRLNLIQVIIYMGFPKLLIEDKPGKVEKLQINVQKELNCINRKLNIAITRIGNPYGHPNILAEFIAGQVKNRVSFQKTMKKAIELTEQADTKGIQIQIAGRTDRKEITRLK